MGTIIFHIDVNSAFLSWSAVEKLKNSSDACSVDLRTIPSIIGGDLASRHGIVLAKSQPAKAYDIKTAEPVASAMRKCPNLVVEKPNHGLYDSCSRQLMALLRTYTSDIEKLSIDECFMDFGPIARLYESPTAAAFIIKEDIKNQLGFTVNIGIAENKLLAKMASDFLKPDRVHTLFHNEIAAKMWPLPVDDLYMVGRASAERLKSLGIRTIGELANTDPDYLQSVFKSHGLMMWEYANGIGDDKVISTVRELKGIGNSVTLSEDAKTKESAYKVLLDLSDMVSGRLRQAAQLAQTVTVEIKYSNFASFSHQMPFFTPTNTANTIYDTSCKLFDELWNGEPIRLLGIRTAKLLPNDTPIQMSIFDLANSGITTDSTGDAENNSIQKPSAETFRQLDAAVDTIRNKYGQDAIVRGSLLAAKDGHRPNPHEKS